MANASLRRDVAWTALGYGAPMVLSLVSGIMLAHLLGPVGRGELQAIQVLPQLFSVLVAFGLPHALTYFTARDLDRSGEHLGTAISASLGLAVPIGIGLALWQPFFLRGYSRDTIGAGVIFVLFVPLTVVVSLPWSVVFAHRRIKLWNSIRMLPQILYAVIALTAVVVRWGQPSGIALTYLLAYALVAGPASWWAYRRAVGQRLRASETSLRELGTYGGLALLSQAPGVFNARFDQAFIAAVLSARALGLYAVAVSWSSLQVLVVNVLTANLILSRLPSANAEQKQRLVSDGIRWGAALAICTSAGLIVCTKLFFTKLFGEDFAAAVPATLVLVTAGGLMAFNQVLSDCFRGLGRPGLTAVAEIVGAVITGFGLWLLVPRGGIVAAAGVSFVSYLSSTIFLLAALWRIVPGLRSDVRDGFLRDWSYLKRVSRQRFHPGVTSSE
jgi:O-antigen/teichoic acid export membrane protein